MSLLVSDSNLDLTISRAIRSLFRNPQYEFMAGGQLRLIKAGIKPSKAWNIMIECRDEFLKEEGVKFGNEKYAWDADAGATLAEEFYIRFMESKP
jgi:hypothetical protein